MAYARRRRLPSGGTVLLGTPRMTSRSKYGNVKARYQGDKYDSIAEAMYAAHLDLQVQAGAIVSWSRQVSLKIAVNGVLICRWRVDFLVETTPGTTEYREVKGRETPDYKLKLKLAHALYPQDRFLIVPAKSIGMPPGFWLCPGCATLLRRTDPHMCAKEDFS